jgi:hypothetical protein
VTTSLVFKTTTVDRPAATGIYEVEKFRRIVRLLDQWKEAEKADKIR